MIGTSGLTAADFEEIDAAAREHGVGVIAAGNFSLTAAMAQAAALLAARHLPHWEVIDYATASKAGRPERDVARAGRAARAPSARRPPRSRPTRSPGRPRRAARRSAGTQVHSLRLPGFVLSTEVIFGLPDERLSIRHDAGGSAAPYVAGTLLAARAVSGRSGLTRGLDTLLLGVAGAAQPAALGSSRRRTHVRDAAQDSTSPPAGSTVADRLRGARSRGFVGRAAELELFRFALEAPEPPFSVLWISGPGGVGKTTLLGVLADAARLVRREPVLLDLRAIEPSPPAFAAELARALGTAAGAPALGGRERPVLMLDTFETAAGLEDWLREEFLPALPAGALVVIAGRDRPAGAWREDPGWRELLRVVSLRNLDPVDARELLRRAQGGGRAARADASSLTHGHPLALWLLRRGAGAASEDGAAGARELGAVPDVVGRCWRASSRACPARDIGWRWRSRRRRGS